MHIVGLISGGKDSIYNLLECVRRGHTIVALANLFPSSSSSPISPGDPDRFVFRDYSAHSLTTAGEGKSGEPAVFANTPATPQELDSFMFQTVGHNAIEGIAACMELPLVRMKTAGKAMDASLCFTGRSPLEAEAHSLQPTFNDEIEDLYDLLQEVKRRYPVVDAVACGAILSNYQRARVEAVAGRLGLLPIAMLWEREQKVLLDEMVRTPCCRWITDVRDGSSGNVQIDSGIDAILIKVAAAGLSTSMLGRNLASVRDTLWRLNTEWGVNVCGEGGEYESLVLDCPLYKRHMLEVTSKRVVDCGGSHFAPVAYIEVEYKLVPKETAPPIKPGAVDFAVPAVYMKGGLNTAREFSVVPDASKNVAAANGWVSIGSITLSTLSDRFPEAIKAHHPDVVAKLNAPDESTRLAGQVDALLMASWCILHSHGATLDDTVFVRLFVRNMQLFGSMNAAYSEFFGKLPPSRSCVEIPFPDDSTDLVAVELTALAQSHQAMLSEDFSLRKVVHVQSLSSWAPLCIGPYSQANVVRDQFVICAGQIGLVPVSMKLISDDLREQLRQSCENVGRVLRSCGSSPQNAACATVYVAAGCISGMAVEAVSSLARERLFDWCSAGKNVAEPSLSGDCAGGRAIISVVPVARLPKDALVEIEAQGNLQVAPFTSASTALSGEGYSAKVRSCLCGGGSIASILVHFSEQSLAPSFVLEATTRVLKETLPALSGVGSVGHLRTWLSPNIDLDAKVAQEVAQSLISCPFTFSLFRASGLPDADLADKFSACVGLLVQVLFLR